jgi:hypothetical protein
MLMIVASLARDAANSVVAWCGDGKELRWFR